MTEVLLLGAGGLLGSALRTRLAGRALVSTYHRRIVSDAVPLDVTNDDLLRAMITETRPDVVIVAAADAWVERCERFPAETRRVNVDPVRRIAELAERTGLRLVVFSSEYVFDGTKGLYEESDTVAPLNEYGRQKVEIELVARSVPRHLICRTSGLFGWDVARKNFVCQLVDRLRRSQAFDVAQDQMITPSYAPAVAAAVVRLLDVDAAGTFHVVGPRALRRDAFAFEVADVFGLPGELIRPVDTAAMGLQARRPPAAGLSDADLRATIGHALIEPRDALEDMRSSEPRA